MMFIKKYKVPLIISSLCLILIIFIGIGIYVNNLTTKTENNNITSYPVNLSYPASFSKSNLKYVSYSEPYCGTSSPIKYMDIYSLSNEAPYEPNNYKSFESKVLQIVSKKNLENQVYDQAIDILDGSLNLIDLLKNSNRSSTQIPAFDVSCTGFGVSFTDLIDNEYANLDKSVSYFQILRGHFPPKRAQEFNIGISIIGKKEDNLINISSVLRADKIFNIEDEKACLKEDVSGYSDSYYESLDFNCLEQRYKSRLEENHIKIQGYLNESYNFFTEQLEEL